MPSMSTIADAIRPRAMAVCRKLFEGKYYHIEGTHFITSNVRGTVPKKKGSTGSLVVWTDTGLWKDYGNTEHRGDLINLIYYVRGCSTLKEAADIALREFSDLPIEVESHKPEKTHGTGSNEKNRRVAQWLFDDKSERLRQTPAIVYLANRGIDLVGLQASHPEAAKQISRVIRFVKDGKHSPGVTCSFMATKITEPGGAFAGIHKVFIRPNGKRYEGATPKQTLGPINSGTAHFGVENPELVVIAEGIEDGLAAKVVVPEHDVWAATSAGHLNTVTLPQSVKFAVVASDNDAAGHAAHAAIVKAHPSVIFVRYVPEHHDINGDLLAFGKDGLRMRFLELINHLLCMEVGHGAEI